MCKVIYRKLVKEVAKQMVIELEANQHKGDRIVWVNMTEDDLLNEVKYHTFKLQTALKRVAPSRRKKSDLSSIKEYCADIANLVGMIMDKAKVIDLDKIDNSRGRHKPKYGDTFS